MKFRSGGAFRQEEGGLGFPYMRKGGPFLNGRRGISDGRRGDEVFKGDDSG